MEMKDFITNHHAHQEVVVERFQKFDSNGNISAIHVYDSSCNNGDSIVPHQIFSISELTWQMWKRTHCHSALVLSTSYNYI